MTSTGMLWIWGEFTSKIKNEISKILREDNTPFRFIDFKAGVTANHPSINPDTDVVLALGGDVLQELKNHGLIKKNLTLGSSRGSVYTLPCGAKCLTSYSYTIRNVDYKLYIDFLGDIKLAVRLLTTGSLTPPPLDFKWVSDLTEVLTTIQDKIATTTKLLDVAIDLETTGLVAYDPDTWIVTFQISTDEESSRVLKFDQEFQPRKPLDNAITCREELIWTQINDILTNPRISLKGANLKFDINWIYEKWGIEITNFKHDTLLAGSLIDENRSNSLKTHAYVYSPFGGYEEDLYTRYDIAKPHEVPDDVLLPYCGYDTAVCLQVARKQKEELAACPQLMRFYVEILHPAARAYEFVERTGVLVDKVYYDDLKQRLEASIEANATAAMKIIPGRIQSKYRDNLSIGRAALVAEFLFGNLGCKLKPVMFTPKPDKKTGLPKPSTTLDHFLKFKDDPVAGGFVTLFKEFKDVAKTLSTYVTGFLEHLRYDNRFHASFFLFKGDAQGTDDETGTNSGRISIKAPALQTVPKKTKWSKPLRRAFIAPEGYVFMSLDYSQGELRLAADFANEEHMLWAYNNGLDLHAVTGAGLADIPIELFMTYKGNDDKELEKIFDVNRQKAKGANFGLALSANSSCLTDLGYVNIQDIQSHHKLWDGVEWVSHDGVISQGEFYVVNWDGLWATPDHNVWIDTGEKIEIQDAIKRSAKLRRTSTISGKPCIWDADISKRGGTSLLFRYCKDGLLKLWQVSSSTGKRFVFRVLQRGYLWEKRQVQSRPTSENARNPLRQYYSTLQQGYTCTVTRLQRQGHQMLVHLTRAFYSLGFGDISRSELQGVGIRQDRQQRSLFTGELASSDECGKSSQHGLQRVYNLSGCKDVLDGMEKPLLSRENARLCCYGHDGGTNNRTSQGINQQEMQELAGVTTKIRGIGILGTIWNKLHSFYISRSKNAYIRMEESLRGRENTIFRVSGVNGGADYSESQRRNKEEAEELQKLGIPIKRVRVYDILNAGSRRRFTCEGKLVSNCYGMGAEGFQLYAETAYGVKMTLAEATDARDKFFETYPGLLPWHERTKLLATQQGFIMSPLGRVRHLPLLRSPDRQIASKELRRSVNGPVQGTLSDMSLWATAIIHKAGHTKKAPICLMVHDQLCAYLPEDNWEYYAKIYKDVMENLPFDKMGWTPKVRFEADLQMSLGSTKDGIYVPPNLADLVDVKKLGFTI